MSLGVLNNLNAVYAENNLNNTSNSLSTVLQQLSSGSRINSGADDAAGLSLVNGLQANSQALMQSETNATEGVGLLTVADGALSQVTNLLNRAVTLATEASNGTLNSTQDLAANQEYQSILSEVSNIGSTTTYNQEQVFGSSTNIYTGDSTQTGASVDALNIRSLSASNLGDSNGAMSYSTGQSNVFINLSNGGTNAAVTDSLNASGATTISVGYMTQGVNGSAVAASANISVGTGTTYSNTAQGLISAINNAGLGLSATFTTAGNAGSAAAATAAASDNGGGSSTNTGIEISASGIGANTTGTNGTGVVGALSLATGDTLGGTLNIVGSDGASHNITLGTADSTDTLVNLESTINAGGYGVTASLNQAQTQLTFTSANSKVAVSGTNITQNTASSTVETSVTGSGLGSITVAGTSDTLGGTLNLVEGADGLGTKSTLTLGTEGTTDTLANLAKTINAGGYGITATLNTTVTPGGNAIGTVLSFTKSAGDLGTASVSGTSVTDAAAPVIVTGDTLGSLSVATSGDTLGAGTLDITSGTTGKSTVLTTGTAGSTDSLANLANTINSGAYGITATLDKTGTNLTFTANAGNTSTAIIASAGNIVDTTAKSTVLTTGASTISTTATALDTITLAGAGDTLQDAGGDANIILTSSKGADTIDMGANGITLAALATAINTGANAAELQATVNQADTTLTITSMAGKGATMAPGAITDSGTTFQDDKVATDLSTAVTASAGTLGTLSVLSSANTLTGTLDITEGADTSETAANQNITGLTLANIAANLDNSEGGVKGNETANWSTDGITATLNSTGTQITFTQTAADKGIAAISTSAINLDGGLAPNGNLAESPIISQGATLGSLDVNLKGDTLGGTLNITSGTTGATSTITLGASGTTDTLADLAKTINAGGYGITATVNATAVGSIAAGTFLTFTQTSGSDTAAITNTGNISDTTAAVSNANINVVSNVLTAANSADTLTGTLEVTNTAGTTSAYNFTGQTLSQIENSFNSPEGANNASGITAGLSGGALTFTMTGGGSEAISGASITDTTPASTSNTAVATGTILNTLTVGNSADTLSNGGTEKLTITDGAHGGTTNVTITQGQTLAELAQDFDSSSNALGLGKYQNLSTYGITATLNSTDTQLTFTQTAGDGYEANIVSDSANPLTDQSAAASTPTPTIAADAAHASYLVVAADTDTLTGTLTLTEGVDNKATTTTLNLGGQTIQDLANDFNTTTGSLNLSNLGITAVLNNAVASSATGITFIANAGETGAASANVTALTSIVDQTGTSTSNITTASGTLLDTLSVGSKSDTLSGTLNLTSGVTGAAAPALTLGASGTTDTLANLATTINGGGYGITAALNSTGTQLTFTQTSGDGFAAAVSGTSIAATANTSVAASSNLGTLAVSSSTDTLTGTLTGVEGNGSTAYTLNLDGQTLTQLASTINTTDAAYGITAVLNQAGTSLNFTTTTGDTGTPTLANEGQIADVTPTGTTNISLTNTPSAAGSASSTALGTLSNVLSTDTLSGSLTIGSSTIAVGSSDDTAASLVSAINKGDYGATAAYNTSTNTITFTSANSSLAIGTGNLDETPINGSTAVAVGSLQGPAVTSSAYYSVGVSGSVTDSSTSGGTANVGITTDSNGTGGTATISYSDAAGQSLSQTNLSSQNGAETALNALNTAITDVAAQDGYIGAQINTLNSVSQVLSTQSENVTSAQNAVQATDYASATSNMSKYEILSQTGISALAQANSMQQEVTKLLQ